MPRFRTFVPFALAALAAAPLSAQQPRAQAPSARCVQDSLPASTLLAVGFGGLEQCSAALSQHDAAQMVLGILGRMPKATMDEHVQPMLDQIVQQVRLGFDQANLSPALLRSVLQRPMAFGLGRPTIKGMGPSVALVVDVGDAGANLDAFVTAVVEAMQEFQPGLRFGTGSIDGRELRTIEIPYGPRVLIARDQELFVATNSEGYLREILAAAHGQAATLASTSLAAHRQRLGAAPLFEAFANTEPLLAMVQPILPYEAMDLGSALGVQSLAGIYAGVAADHGGTAESLGIGLRGPQTGMLKAAFSGSADFSAATYCSPDTVAFGTLRCNLPATFAGYEAIFDSLPETLAARNRSLMRNRLREGMRRLGLSTDQASQLLASVAGSMSFAVSLQKGTSLPELLVVLPLRDRAVVEPWIERGVAMAQQQGIEWKVRDADGVAIRFCDVPADGLPMRLPLAPAFALRDDCLLIASQPRVIVDALKQHADPTSSLAGVDDFTAAVAANKDAAAMLHLRQGHGVDLAWRMIELYGLKPLDSMRDELGFDREVLPEQSEIVRAVGSTTVSLTVDGDGLHWRSRGNLMPGGLLVGGAVMVDEVLQRVAGRVY